MSGMYPQSQVMLEHFRFHLSYDWLHRAYVDFKDLKFVNTIDQNTHESKCFVFREYFTNKDIKTAFEHLAESIEWATSKRTQNSNQIRFIRDFLNTHIDYKNAKVLYEFHRYSDTHFIKIKGVKNEDPQFLGELIISFDEFFNGEALAVLDEDSSLTKLKDAISI